MIDHTKIILKVCIQNPNIPIPVKKKKRKEKKVGDMVSWESAISVVLGVIMRKSICMLHEASKMIIEYMSVATAAVRFTGYAVRGPVWVQVAYSPLSSMWLRHDR